jgi:hypothetical protein
LVILRKKSFSRDKDTQFTPELYNKSILHGFEIRFHDYNCHLIKGGCHALSLEIVQYLLKNISLLEGDYVWEIGAGYPRLAAIVNFMTKKTVIATDIGKTFLFMLINAGLYCLYLYSR